MAERFWETPLVVEEKPDFEKMSESELLATVENPDDLAVRKAVEIGKLEEIQSIINWRFHLSKDTADLLIECGYIDVVADHILHFDNLDAEIAQKLTQAGHKNALKSSYGLDNFPHLKQIKEYVAEEQEKEHNIAWVCNSLTQSNGSRSINDLIQLSDKSWVTDIIETPEVKAAVRKYYVNYLSGFMTDVGMESNLIEFRNKWRITDEELPSIYKTVIENQIEEGRFETALTHAEHKGLVDEIKHDQKFLEIFPKSIVVKMLKEYLVHDHRKEIWDKLGGTPEMYRTASLESAKELFKIGNFLLAKKLADAYSESDFGELSAEYVSVVKEGLLYAVEHGAVDQIECGLKFFASEEVKTSDEFKEKAIQGVSRLFTLASSTKVDKSFSDAQKLISIAGMRAEEVQRALGNAVPVMIKGGAWMSFPLLLAEKLDQLDFYLEFIKKEPQRTLFREKLLEKVQNGRIQVYEIDSFFLSLGDKEFIHTPEFQKAAQEGLSVTMYNYGGNHDEESRTIQSIREYISKLEMSADSMEDAGVKAIGRVFAQSKIDLEYALDIQKQWNVPQEKVQREAVKAIESHFDMQYFKSAMLILSEKSFKLPASTIDEPLRKAFSTDDGIKFVLSDLEVFPSEVLERFEQDYYLVSYRHDLDIAAPRIYHKYIELKKAGDIVQLSGYVETIKSNIEKLIGPNAQKESIAEMENYKELIGYVYPNHADRRTSFESNEECLDRSGDLKNLDIKPVYKIDLREGVDMKLRDGQEKDVSALEAVERPISSIQSRFAEVGFKKEEMFKILDLRIDDCLKSIPQTELYQTREEKLFALVLESLLGRFETAPLKELMIGYQFAQFEDIQGYLAGTRDRAEKSKNSDYAYLLELHEFYADHLKDVQRRIIEEASKNPAIKNVLPQYYDEKRILENTRSTEDKLNRLQIGKIGLESGLLDRILKEIQKKTGKKGAVTSLVETGEDGQLKLGKRGQAIAGMISGEQKKAAQALELLTGEKIDPASINLDELNLKQIAEVQSKMEKGDYDEELFGKYLLQAFQGVFEKELSGIDRELGKYQPKEESRRDKQMLTVEGFITKNHTSAHARGVGGVCVSGDNPEGNEPNQWDMPNYLQMVLRDEKTKVCQGLVLMHIYEQDNEKVLTASFNPSSTYLFKVDEQQLFAGLLHQLKDFASANGIDKIAVSKNTQIRTNRTGGEFERAIVDAIQSKNKGFDFKEGQVFSYKPAYQQKELDLL